MYKKYLIATGVFVGLGLFFFTSSLAQTTPRNTIEIGRTFYRFPNWNSSYAQEGTIGSLYYSHTTTFRNTPVRWSVDANLLAGLLTNKDPKPFGKVGERKLFLSNICIGNDLFQSNKKHDLYINTGVALRVGYEYFVLGRESSIKKILWLPGVNFSMDYSYHLSKNLVFHPFAGLNVFAERTYFFGYAGANVGWAFGKK